MKKLLTLALGLFAVAALAQTFEGKINYTNTFKSKTPQMSNQQWEQMLGAKQEYFIKGGNYKSVTNGGMRQWQLYTNAQNKVYTKMANSETLLWNDAAENLDEVLKAEVKNNAATILGYVCNELTLTCKSGVQKYYYAPNLAVDAKLYEKHKYGNWYDFISRAKSLTLKTIIETPQFVMESIATEVKPQKLDDSMFTIPAGVKTEKSPY
jgi:hypothetical protein